MDNDSDDVADTFQLFVYSVPPSKVSAKRQTNAVSFLEEHGTPCCEAVLFPHGTVFKFFQCVHSLIGLDVIQLVGGGRVTDPSTFPHEEELFGGGLEREVSMVFVAKVAKLEETDQGKTEARERAKQMGLDPEWFVKNLAILAIACGRVLEREGVVVTLFE